MDILRLLWTPFALVGRSFGRYWLGAGRHDGDAGALARGEVSASRVAPAVESLSLVLVVTLVAALMVSAALHA